LLFPQGFWLLSFQAIKFPKFLLIKSEDILPNLYSLPSVDYKVYSQ